MVDKTMMGDKCAELVRAAMIGALAVTLGNPAAVYAAEEETADPGQMGIEIAGEAAVGAASFGVEENAAEPQPDGTENVTEPESPQPDGTEDIPEIQDPVFPVYLPSHPAADFLVLLHFPSHLAAVPPHFPPHQKKQPQRLLPLQSLFPSVPDLPFPLLLHKRLPGFPVSLRAHQSSRRAPARRICRPSLFYQPFSLSPIQFARPEKLYRTNLQ